METLCDYCKPLLPPGREYAFATTGGMYHHPGQCRQVDTPWRTFWTDRHPQNYDPASDFNTHERTGLTMLDEVYEPDGHPFPEDAPGYRRLADNWIEAVVVIVRGEAPKDVTSQHTEHDSAHDMEWGYDYGSSEWETAYTVRPATAEEAEGAGIDETAGAFNGPVD